LLDIVVFPNGMNETKVKENNASPYTGQLWILIKITELIT